jgi:hypothetical protein
MRRFIYYGCALSRLRFAFVCAFAAAIVTTLATPLNAQWPAFVRKETPLTADGKPDLNALPPRLPNGKIDFSGTWESRQPPSGRPGPALPNLNPATDPPLAAFANVGQNFKDGLPFTPWAAELRKQRMSTNSKDNPDAHCLPLGFMQLHTHSQPRKVVQTANDIVIMYEANGGLRNIFTDGRALPTNDPTPWWFGYSVGKYEGDTLVVETVGLRDEGWLDVQGAPFTNSAKITEKFRRPSYGRIEIDVTINDPKAYTKPWTVRVNWRLAADEDLIEFICQENNVDEKFLK